MTDTLLGFVALLTDNVENLGSANLKFKTSHLD